MLNDDDNLNHDLPSKEILLVGFNFKGLIKRQSTLN